MKGGIVGGWPAAAPGGGEATFLHDPRRVFTQTRRGIVTASDGYNLIFQNVAVRGNTAAGISSARRGCGRLHDVCTHQEVIGIGRGDRTAVADCSGDTLCPDRGVQRIQRVETAVLSDTNVRMDRRS